MKLATFFCGVGIILAVLTGCSARHLPSVNLRVDEPVGKAIRVRDALHNQTNPQPKVKLAAAFAAAVSDERFQELVTQGCMLLQAMGKTDAETAEYVRREGTAESPWKDPADLKKWGYVPQGEDAEQEMNMGYGPKVDEALQASEIGTLGSGTHKLSALEHRGETVHGEKTYPATNGYFRNFINVKEGSVVRWSNYGPRHTAAKNGIPMDKLPLLRNMNDILFLAWKEEAANLKVAGTTLKLIIASHIVNSETLKLIDRALRAVGRGPMDDDDEPEDFDDFEHCPQYGWDTKVTIPVDQETGKALLASDNGRSGALLMIQHKGTFGDKTTISGISMFCSTGPEEEWEVNLVFHMVQS